MPHTQTLFATLTAAAALALAGCASVSVNKLDPVTGRVVEGSAEGLRFYLPRPYVSVFEPFIIDSRTYLARGEISPDGNYVLLTQVPDALKDAVLQGLSGSAPGPGMGNLRIDATQVRAAEPAPGGAPQSAAVPAPAASAASAPEAKAKPSGGILNYKATNDNTAFAVTPQPRYFNILWLPDFDEQYVVTARAGLGNAGVEMGFGQGWSLQSLDAKVDNSALANVVLDTLMSVQKVATAKIEGALAALGGQQSAGVAGSDARSFAGGTPVTVKITKVRIVAPGLYPVLKPKEAAAIQVTDEQKGRILVPVPPLTNIAFNTYEVIVVEAARTTGDSALRVHQYVDSSAPAAAGGGGAAKRSEVSAADPLLDQAQKSLRIELSKPENVTQAKEFFSASLRREGTAIKVTLQQSTDSKAGNAAALPDDAALKSKVIALLKSVNTVVADGDISIVRKP